MTHIPNLNTAEPPPYGEDGFLLPYLDYTANQESPSDFHFWVGLSLISSVLGRRVWFDMQHYKIYPNLFTVLVAESGKLHKSTAINMGIDLLKTAIPDVRYFAEKLSTEALIRFLADQSKKTGSAVATICAPEFAVFFGKSHVDPSLIQLLTDFYDNPTSRKYETVARGSEECTNICLNMLAGSTPQWIRTSLPEESVGGGFASRLLMVYRTATDKQKVAFPQLVTDPESLSDHKERCILALRAISGIKSGPYHITRDAISYYEDWYQHHEVDSAPPGMRGYYSRLPDYLLKLSMLLAANASDKRLITQPHLELARKKLKENEAGAAEVLSEINQTDFGRALARVRAMFLARENLGPGLAIVYKNELVRTFSHTMGMQDLEKIIQTLESGDEIFVTKCPSGSGRLCYALKPKEKKK